MWITSANLITAVGLTGATATAALRARIKRFREIPFRDEHGQPIVASPVAAVTDGHIGWPRLQALASAAIRGCLGAPPRTRTALLLLLPEANRSGRPKQVEDRLREDLLAEFGLHLSPEHIKVLSSGRAGGLAALLDAQHMLASGQVQRCLLVGVDSYLNRNDLRQLELERRLKTDENSDGFVPAEGAAALLLTAIIPVHAMKVRVHAAASDHETAGVLSDAPCRAEALTRCTRAALDHAGLDLSEVAFRITDITGERYDFVEHANMLGRLLRKRREHFPSWMPATSFGHMGAAAGITLLAVAYHAWLRGHAPGPTALCCAGSDAGLRATVVLTRE